MLGDGYIAQHISGCMTQESRERLYRAYVTDALYAMAGGSEAMSSRWADLDPGWVKPEKPTDPEKVKNHILDKINGEEE